MEQLKTKEPSVYNAEQRLYDDVTTWLAETVRGSMQSEFAYNFDSQELRARDGSSVKEIFEDAVEAADELPANLYFEARRRREELREYEDMIAMAKGELPNTMVVVSDFPAELMASAEDIGGYNVSRKQTMLRVITRRDDQIYVQSQSLDSSDREALEGIYDYLEVEAPDEGELLGQRRFVQLNNHLQQEVLIDNLTRVYDEALHAKTGQPHYAGIKNGRRVNTYNFVCAQTDILGVYLDSVNDIYDNDQLRYAVAASITERFEATISGRGTVLAAETAAHSRSYVADQIWQAGQRAATRGKTFSGCGGSITMTANEELNDLGYGSKAEEKTTYSFSKKQYCVVCQDPPKDEEPKKMCGPCGICRSCDAKL